MKLFCVVVGAQGSAFPVEINTDQFMGELKEVIKAKKPNDLKGVDANKLQLFLAKKDAWLTEEEAAAVGGDPVSQGFKMMKSTMFLKNPKNFGEDSQPGEGHIHVLVVVPQQEQARSGLWLVTGSVEDALATVGVRCKLYWMATLRVGCYDPTHRIGNKNVAFWYQDKKLCFHVLFETKEAALLFETDLRTGPQTLGSPLIDLVVDTRVERAGAVSTSLHRIFYADYIPDVSESPQHTMSSISLTTRVDASTDEFCFQRIEDEKLFLPYGKAESCHLVSRNQTRERELAKYDRDPNNKLALSRDMHGWFDGMIPIVNMWPGEVEENQSLDNRYKVEVFVKV